jgi:signal transduction histidine kinase
MLQHDQRLLALLERLFEIAPMPVDVVLSQCADLIGNVTAAEKVDAFLHDVDSNTLIAVGTAHTPLAQLQKSLGLDRLPIANGDPMSIVFQSGEPYLNGRCDQDPRQPRGVIDAMHIRSMLAVPIEVGGERRGVISLASPKNDAFSAGELSLMRIVAVWVASLMHRSELIELHATHARDQGRRAAAEELITVFAHDLRNLVVPISIRLQLLMLRAETDARADDVQDLQRAIAGIESMNELMNNLLDVSRIEHGLMSLDREPFDLVALVRSTAETLALPQVGVEVASYVDKLTIAADRKRLAQALQNVLSNATRHSPAHATVHVLIERTSLQARPAVKIAIIDEGPGIPAELLPTIFERYVAGAGSTGLGLGLFLARAMISAHGGSITLTSGAKSGTRCEIVLPLTAAEHDG